MDQGLRSRRVLPDSRIRSLDGQFPALENVSRTGLTFDLIWLSAGWMHVPPKSRQRTFRIRISGQSMEPKFHDGDLVFVDPQVLPTSGKYVVVRLEDSHEATFKQSIVEGGRQYSKALNPDWPDRIIKINVDATICGVVVFKEEVV